MARKILIVDDNSVNRQMLKKTLCNDYDILEAADGREALIIMRRYYKMLSAVLLDIIMPEMDGYEVLLSIRDNVVLSQIPVIMVTGSEDESSRVKALSLGANDFILKPFNPEIVKHCLRNNIALRETASILNAIQKDKLTGLYNRETFFDKVGALIKERDSGYYTLYSFDIDNFKLINDQYGAEEGDNILRETGRVIRKEVDAIDGIAGRISADNFSMVIPTANKELSITSLNRMAFSDKLPIVFSEGRYVIWDLSLQASAIYDRAYIAKRSVKGRYDKHIAYFDDKMLDKLVRNQQIIADMDIALAKNQFEVWFQPQYNHATNALIGAEALVRWRHPQKGIVSPGDFIPVFEQNGFIYELDKFVWEETCRYLRKWIDEERKPLPISVNISRYDIFREDLVEAITGLVDKYNIPVDLLRLEITESAFSTSTKIIINIVKKLINCGFTVEIDDFGSGYSSLNTLKDVPAQILKLDMRFLENVDSAQRGGNILESIVRMAKWLDMAIIAEGVETVEQADFLKSIGSNYVQGFLYARPMPAEEYELLAKQVLKEERLISRETVETLDSESFWNPKSMDTLVFNSFVGGACVFEFCEGNVELLRINDNYRKELGIQCETGESLNILDPFRYMDKKDREKLNECAKKAIASGYEQTEEFRLSDVQERFPQEQFVRCSLRVIARAGEHYLFYCIINNITEQTAANEQLRFLNDVAHDLLAQPDTESGINRTLGKLREYFNADRAYIFEFDYDKGIAVNTYEVCSEGISSEKDNLNATPLSVISIWLDAFEKQGYYSIDNVETLDDCRTEEKNILLAQGIRTIFVVPLRRDGRIIGMKGIDDPKRQYAQMNRLVALGDFIAVMLTRRDLNAQIISESRELLDNLPNGAALYEYDGKTLSVIHLNKRYWQLVNRDAAEYCSPSFMDAVHPEDRDVIERELKTAIRENINVVCDIRILYGRNQYRFFRIVGSIVPKENGKYSIYASYTPVSEDSMS